MDTLSSNEKAQIRQILQMPQWATIERAMNLMCMNIGLNPKVQESEWETLKSCLLDEGQIRGIRNFIQELYHQAQ